MWGLLAKALETGGTVALIFAFTIMGVVAVVTNLWGQNQGLQRELRDAHSRFTDAIQDIHREHMEAIAELHEKRTQEARAVLSDVVEHVRRVDRSMEKLSSSLETLVQILRGK